MSQNDYSLDIQLFLSNVLEPSESFARLFQNAHLDVMINHGKGVDIKATSMMWQRCPAQ